MCAWVHEPLYATKFVCVQFEPWGQFYNTVYFVGGVNVCLIINNHLYRKLCLYKCQYYCSYARDAKHGGTRELFQQTVIWPAVTFWGWEEKLLWTCLLQTGGFGKNFHLKQDLFLIFRRQWCQTWRQKQICIHYIFFWISSVK